MSLHGAGAVAAAWPSTAFLASHLLSWGLCEYLLGMGQENQLAGTLLDSKMTYLTVLTPDSSCRLVKFSWDMPTQSLSMFSGLAHACPTEMHLFKWCILVVSDKSAFCLYFCFEKWLNFLSSQRSRILRFQAAKGAVISCICGRVRVLEASDYARKKKA